ncbi:putative neprosin [Helianthus annuus]|nr:putative neprosin [Helianthus annuus]
MQSSSYHETPWIIFVLVLFSLLFSTVVSKDFLEENETSMRGNKSKKMKLINAHLKKINKPFLKSIKSSDGDIIDCVLFHLQPAFDLSELRGKMSLIPPELPKEHANAGKNPEIKQLWNSKGESCPNGTIPIKRTRASDIFRFSISKFGKKYSRKDIPVSTQHEHAVGCVTQREFYGAKALLNVWRPNVTGNDFSLSQIWVIADVSNRPVNTIEVGWQVYPSLHKDSLPRLFTYWTADGYQSGCYNLVCPGFVQTNPNVCLGAAIDPTSKYGGQQYEGAYMIWKDPKSADWWLRVGTEVIGFWPSNLFTDLRDHATIIEYGGEVYAENLGTHTSTQMGSGHFQNEGFRKAAYARKLEVVDHDNHLIGVSNLGVISEKPNCYGVKNGYSDAWGNYIYFGGPGYNPNCL